MIELTLEERLTELEIKVSFQETTIEALNSVVRRQQLEINDLSAKITALYDRLTQQNEGVNPLQEKPPHY